MADPRKWLNRRNLRWAGLAALVLIEVIIFLTMRSWAAKLAAGGVALVVALAVYALATTRKRWLRWVSASGLGLLAVLAIGGYIFVSTQMTHHTMTAPPAPITPSGDPVLDSIRRGIEYLKVHQEPDGEFSAGMLDPKPAFTAMVVDALARSPDRYDESHPFMKKAVDAILSHQKDYGGIYSLGFGNYVTSVSVMALNRMDNPDHKDALIRAREYIQSCQRDSGGMGYGPSSRPDLSNTALALEALNELGLPKEDETFKRAISFITRCQNDNEQNDEEWATADGGFIYHPGNSPAGEYEQDGKKRFTSYGLMTYAGLVSFLWAGVDRDDPRVQSAFRWVSENWTLEENKNCGDSGLYYYYLTMAKALQAYGQRIIKTTDGQEHDWPVELAEKVMSLQREDGSWVSTKRRYLETDSILVTSYMVRTLSICHEVIGAGKGED